jgi:NADP-dependent 3-hydroxy acid dehydrogenase YdfG
VALAAEGAKVELLARSASALAEVAAEIGPAARAVPVDVTNPVGISRAFAEIGERHQHVDLLVNNAGAGAPHTLQELTADDLHSEIAVNFFAPLLCIRASLPLLRLAGHSDVINISSTAVLSPYPTMWLYTAGKAALEHASLGLVDELRPDGVRITVLRVGSIAGTSFQDDWDEGRKQRAFAIARGMGREHFAGTVPIAPGLLAAWIVEISNLAPEARIGLIDVRPS